MQQAPLAGIRVIELTTAWAGPMAGRILAFLGAEVIRIEPASRPCSWRHHGETSAGYRYPDGEPGAQPYNRSALFNSQNVNKRSVALDLKRPGGQATLLKMLAKADALITNFTPGTLGRLKLDYPRLCEAKPDIIVVEMPAFGTSGPMAKYTALGPTMEMATGMASMIGYRNGGPPTYTGPSYMDPIGGYNGAAAVMTALAYRRTTGRGQHVEVPQVEAAMQYIGPELLLAIATGRDPERTGNRVDWAAPHDSFPALGDDQWVVIAALDDTQWQALCETVDDPRLRDPGFASLAGRVAGQDRLNDILSDWTRTRPKLATAELLQARGVAAAPVQKADDARASPYLAARGFYTELVHPEAGRHRHPGLPFHFSRSPIGATSAAPGLGEHTLAVLQEWLQLPAQEIEALQAAGTIANTPDARAA